VGIKEKDRNIGDVGNLMHMRNLALMLVMLQARPVLALQTVAFDQVIVAARVGDSGPARDGAAVARKDQTVTLFAAARLRRKGKAVWVTRAPGLLLGGKRVATMTPEDAKVGSIALRWSTVEPVPAHIAAGGQAEPYSNAVLGTENHGAWRGYDALGYFETALGEFTEEGWTRAGSARPPRPADDTWDGLGTMRFKVELRGGGSAVASPGAEATDERGLKKSVLRVTVRRDDSFLGWLTSYFLVPEVFGSAGPGKDHQTDRYVGADCADVLVGALRASGSRVDYTSAAGLVALTKHVAGPFQADERGVMTATGTATGGAVAPGDLILIRYAGPWATGTGRAWDHVGALWEDRGVKGVLDGEDLIIHMGHPRLEIEPLASQSPAVFDVIRWDARKISR
jgi:hypothetical protein